MADDVPRLEQAEVAQFNDHAENSRLEVIGSGISQSTRISFDLLANPELLGTLPPPWVANRAMIVKLFTPIFERSFQCPGRSQQQCCQAVSDQSCRPNWREREDAEWYAQQITTYLSMVDRRLQNATSITAALAADEAFELGCLFTEALIKFRWDKHAKRGKLIIESAARGGEGSRKRPGIEATVDAVDQLAEQGISITRAYTAVAKRQGVTAQTIAKEYRRAKKLVSLQVSLRA